MTQSTQATIGNGTIQTTSSLSGLNRDIGVTQKMTKDQKTGGLNVNLTIDNAVFANPVAYFAPIVELPGNVVQAGENTQKALGNFIGALVDNLSGKGRDGLFKDYSDKLRNQDLALKAKTDPALKKSMENFVKDPKSVETALETQAKNILASQGLDASKLDIVFYYNQADGVNGGQKDGKIYINLAYQTGNVDSLMEVVGHELDHYVDVLKGRGHDDSREAIARAIGTDAKDQTQGYVGGAQPTDAEVNAFRANVGKIDFSQANKEVASAVDMDYMKVEPKVSGSIIGFSGSDAKALLNSLKKTTNQAGNLIQSVPGPVYGAAGIATGLVVAGATVVGASPIVVAGATYLGLSMGVASVIKTGEDMYDKYQLTGQVSNKDIASVALNISCLGAGYYATGYRAYAYAKTALLYDVLSNTKDINNGKHIQRNR